MKITEIKLRRIIRGVIREFTSSATATGAKKKGYESPDTKSKKTDYDTKQADYDTKQADYRTKQDTRSGIDNKRYRPPYPKYHFCIFKNFRKNILMFIKF